jgi:hypothetical protein
MGVMEIQVLFFGRHHKFQIPARAIFTNNSILVSKSMPVNGTESLEQQQAPLDIFLNCRLKESNYRHIS